MDNNSNDLLNGSVETNSDNKDQGNENQMMDTSVNKNNINLPNAKNDWKNKVINDIIQIQIENKMEKYILNTSKQDNSINKTDEDENTESSEVVILNEEISTESNNNKKNSDNMDEDEKTENNENPMDAKVVDKEKNTKSENDEKNKEKEKEKKRPGPKPGWKQKFLNDLKNQIKVPNVDTEEIFSRHLLKQSLTNNDEQYSSNDISKRKPGPRPGWKQRLMEDIKAEIRAKALLNEKASKEKEKDNNNNEGKKSDVLSISSKKDSEWKRKLINDLKELKAKKLREETEKIKSKKDLPNNDKKENTNTNHKKPGPKPGWKQNLINELKELKAKKEKEINSTPSSSKPEERSKKPGPKPGWKQKLINEIKNNISQNDTKKLLEMLKKEEAKEIANQSSSQSDGSGRKKPGPKTGWKVLLIKEILEAKNIKINSENNKIIYSNNVKADTGNIINTNTPQTSELKEKENNINKNTPQKSSSINKKEMNQNNNNNNNHNHNNNNNTNNKKRKIDDNTAIESSRKSPRKRKTMDSPSKKNHEPVIEIIDLDNENNVILSDLKIEKCFSLKYIIRPNSKREHAENDDSVCIWDCAFEPTIKGQEASHIAATCGANSVSMIDCHTGKVVAKYTNLIEVENYYSLAWTLIKAEDNVKNYSCSILAAGGQLGKIVLLNKMQGECFRYAVPNIVKPKPITQLRFSEKNPYWLFAGSEDKIVYLYDIGKLNDDKQDAAVNLVKFVGLKKDPTSLNVTDKQLVVGCSDGSIVIYNLDNIPSVEEAQNSVHLTSIQPFTKINTLHKTYIDDIIPIYSLNVKDLPVSYSFVSRGAKDHISLWSMEKQKKTRSLSKGNNIKTIVHSNTKWTHYAECIRFSILSDSNETILLTGQGQGKIQLYKINTNTKKLQLLGTLSHIQSVEAIRKVDISLDKKYLIGVNESNLAFIWEFNS